MLMTYADIAEKLGYTPNYVRDKLRKKVVNGIRFPKPDLELSQKNRKWFESTINAYTEAIRKNLQR